MRNISFLQAQWQAIDVLYECWELPEPFHRLPICRRGRSWRSARNEERMLYDFSKVSSMIPQVTSTDRQTDRSIDVHTRHQFSSRLVGDRMNSRVESSSKNFLPQCKPRGLGFAKLHLGSSICASQILIVHCRFSRRRNRNCQLHHERRRYNNWDIKEFWARQMTCTQYKPGLWVRYLPRTQHFRNLARCTRLCSCSWQTEMFGWSEKSID